MSVETGFALIVNLESATLLAVPTSLLPMVLMKPSMASTTAVFKLRIANDLWSPLAAWLQGGYKFILFHV
jgi:hypothetical protein